MSAAPATTTPTAPPQAVAANRQTWKERLGPWAPAAAVTPLFALFLLFKIYGNWGASSDENIYFYMSARTAFDGLWPFKDYFFAHPPLHIFLSIIVFKVASFFTGGATAWLDPACWQEGATCLSIAKWIPMASGAIAGLFVYKAARRAGELEAVVATAAFLLAHDVLRPTSHFTGVAEAAMFTAIGVDRLLEGKDRQAGLAFAAGCLVAMYVAPTGLAVWLVLLVVSWRRALTLAIWTGAPLILVHGFFLVWAGASYWDQVFMYHLKKPEVAGTFNESFRPLLYHNAHLFFVLPTAVLAAVMESLGLLGLKRPAATAQQIDRASRRRAERGKKPSAQQRSRLDEVFVDLFSLERLRVDPRRQLLVFTFIGVTAQLIFIASLGRVFQFYFVMTFVSLGMLSGFAYASILRAGWQMGRALVKNENAMPLAVAFVLLAGSAGVGELWGRSRWARSSEVPDQLVGRPIPQYWREAPRMGWVNGAMKSLFWDDQQTLGQYYSAMTYYMWHESRVFEVPTVAARYIAATTPPDAEVFGDSTSVPLAALMSGRRLSLDEADTNAMRFSSQTTPSLGFIEKLRRKPPLVILAGRGRGFFGLPEFQDWLRREYDLVQTISDRNHGEYYLLRRKGM